MIDSEKQMGTSIEAQYYKSSFVNPHTGRNNQILICQ